MALNIHGFTTRPLRGDCLVSSPKAFARKGDGKTRGLLEGQNEVLAAGYLLSNLRARQEAEIAFGTAHRKVTVYRLRRRSQEGRIDEGSTINEKECEPLRLVLEGAAYLRPGDRFLLMRPGGADILGWGEVLWAGKTTAKERDRVMELFGKRDRAPTSQEVEGALKGREEEGDGKLEGSGSPLPLPARTLNLYQEIQGKGETPWELQPGSGSSIREDVDRLCKGRMIVPLDSSLYLETHAYNSLVQRILSGRSVGERFTIGEAKEATGLSRKYILPLLNRMERDGWVKRWGDDRVILRI